MESEASIVPEVTKEELKPWLSVSPSEAASPSAAPEPASKNRAAGAAGAAWGGEEAPGARTSAVTVTGSGVEEGPAAISGSRWTAAAAAAAAAAACLRCSRRLRVRAPRRRSSTSSL
eukprot:scaffold20289_cov45-Isochrysis_galbana.AAC.1